MYAVDVVSHAGGVLEQPACALQLTLNTGAVRGARMRGGRRRAERARIVLQAPALAVVAQDVSAVTPQRPGTGIVGPLAEQLDGGGIRRWAHVELGDGTAELLGAQRAGGEELRPDPRERDEILVACRGLLGGQQIGWGADHHRQAVTEVESFGAPHPRDVVADAVGRAHDLELTERRAVRAAARADEVRRGAKGLERGRDVLLVAIVDGDRDVDVDRVAAVAMQLQRDAANEHVVDVVRGENLQQATVAIGDRRHVTATPAVPLSARIALRLGV